LIFLQYKCRKQDRVIASVNATIIGPNTTSIDSPAQAGGGVAIA